MRDKKFYREATLNNTFNLEAAEKALNDIQISSFQYLNEIQMKNTIELRTLEAVHTYM